MAMTQRKQCAEPDGLQKKISATLPWFFLWQSTKILHSPRGFQLINKRDGSDDELRVG
jgi:hypothetical protein